VVNDPSVLTVGGSRLQAFRSELADLSPAAWSNFRHQAERQIEAAEKHGGRILLYGDPAYPPTLMASAYPVPILFARGATSVLLEARGIACVGTRGIREPYETLHRAFATAAVAAGHVVVSGFALGADTVGHTAAWAAGGKTIGTMPGGLDRPFPPENRSLWNELLEYQGAVFVSEAPFGTGASAMLLRKRNKLIVALSRGVLISQTSAKGGAMNAYRFALEEHKPVATFASDGSDDTSGNVAIARELRAQPAVFGTVEPSPGEYSSWLRQFDSWI
jgi:DNA processing protein